MPTPQFLRRYRQAWKTAPAKTLRDTALVGGLGLFTANQAMNLLSEERRRATADVVSKNMSKAVIDTVIPPELMAEARQELVKLPGGISDAAKSGVQSGLAEGVHDLFKSIQARPGPWIAAGTVAVGAPTLAYLLANWKPAKKPGKSRKLRRVLERRRNAITEAPPVVDYDFAKTAGWRFWRSSPATPKPMPSGKPTPFSDKVVWGLGLGGLGLGMYNTGRGLLHTSDALDAMVQNPDSAQKLIKDYADQTAKTIRESVSVGDVGSVLGEATGRAVTDMFKSPWFYAGVGATVAAPYLLAQILSRRRRRRKPVDGQPKTAEVTFADFIPGLATVGAAGTLLLPGVRRRVFPLAGTGATYLSAGLGYGTTVDPQLPARVYSGAAAEALPLAMKTVPAFREEVSEPIVKQVKQLSTQAPPVVKRMVAERSRGFLDDFRDSVERNPGYAGAAMGIGVGAAGTLGYLLWKRMKDEAVEVQRAA